MSRKTPLLSRLCPSCPSSPPHSPSSIHPFLWNSCSASSLASRPPISPSSPVPTGPQRALYPGLACPAPCSGPSSVAPQPLSLVSVVLYLFPHAPLWPHITLVSSVLFQPHRAVGRRTGRAFSCSWDFAHAVPSSRNALPCLLCLGLQPIKHLPVKAPWRGCYPSPSAVADVNTGSQGPSPAVTPPGPDDSPADRSGCRPFNKGSARHHPCRTFLAVILKHRFSRLTQFLMFCCPLYELSSRLGDIPAL